MTKNLAIANLTKTLQHEQWEDAQKKLHGIINSFSQCVKQACMTKPTPSLTNQAKNQRVPLLKTQQNLWNLQLKLHHNIRMATWTTCTYFNTHFQNNPDIIACLSIKIINIPPSNPIEHTWWIENLANIGKNAKIKTYKITSKQTAIKFKITIIKYKTLLINKPIAIHKKHFTQQPTTISTAYKTHKHS